MHNSERLARAHCALEGLSVGDAFGEQFFTTTALAETMIDERSVPSGPWPYTDDTEMALSVFEVLQTYGSIDQDQLAQRFMEKYDIRRGYGPNMHHLLERIRNGDPWHIAAPSLFDGQGSLGNGAAMRVAPIGSYFADDLETVVAQARLSAEVTHSHPEAIAGTIAVAVATAIAWQGKDTQMEGTAFLDQILPFVPDSHVREKIRHARNLGANASVRLAVSALGNGVGLSAPDTVPFALWCAAAHLYDYEEALWLTVSGLGDRDTTCAIVGGIVALSAGAVSIPDDWKNAREALPIT